MLLRLFVALLIATSAAAQRVEVTLPSNAVPHGHLILVFSKDAKSEPRMQMDEQFRSAQGFGVDAGIDGAKAAGTLVVDAKTVGYPRRSLADLDAGDYFVQGVFNVYEEFHLASGRNVWLPPDRGEGQKWNRKPGNPFSKPVKVHFDPKSDATLKITLDQVIPEIKGTPADPAVIAAKQPEAKWLKYMRFRSEKLSKFWGRDMYLGAWVLLPDGFDEHPNARYPLVLWQDHYSAGMKPTFTAAAPPAGASPRGASGYRFFQDWTTGRLPHVIMLFVQNANPYYDDSYVVDSVNVGPYGSAINDELIPAVETKYRGIGQGWARATAGGSTGGWEALATQVFYPDRYNGAYGACPDPVDFTRTRTSICTRTRTPSCGRATLVRYPSLPIVSRTAPSSPIPAMSLRSSTSLERAGGRRSSGTSGRRSTRLRVRMATPRR